MGNCRPARNEPSPVTTSSGFSLPSRYIWIWRKMSEPGLDAPDNEPWIRFFEEEGELAATDRDPTSVLSPRRLTTTVPGFRWQRAPGPTCSPFTTPAATVTASAPRASVRLSASSSAWAASAWAMVST
jgi:hypothetical protein